LNLEPRNFEPVQIIDHFSKKFPKNFLTFLSLSVRKLKMCLFPARKEVKEKKFFLNFGYFFLN